MTYRIEILIRDLLAILKLRFSLPDKGNTTKQVFQALPGIPDKVPDLEQWLQIEDSLRQWRRSSVNGAQFSSHTDLQTLQPVAP